MVASRTTLRTLLGLLPLSESSLVGCSHIGPIVGRIGQLCPFSGGVPSQAQRAGSWSKEKAFELSPTKMPRGRTDNPVVGAPSSDVRSSTFRHCSAHGVTLNSPPGLRTGA